MAKKRASDGRNSRKSVAIDIAQHFQLVRPPIQDVEHPVDAAVVSPPTSLGSTSTEITEIQ